MVTECATAGQLSLGGRRTAASAAGPAQASRSFTGRRTGFPERPHRAEQRVRGDPRAGGVAEDKGRHPQGQNREPEAQALPQAPQIPAGPPSGDWVQPLPTAGPTPALGPTGPAFGSSSREPGKPLPLSASPPAFDHVTGTREK